MSRRILLVDDNADIRTLAGIRLEKVGGHEVRTADSGQACLDLLAGWTPDVVVLDVKMPGMDGTEVLDRIRADEATSTVPVVFLTASLVPDEVERLRTLPVSGVMAKPFDPMTLPDELGTVLGW